MPSARQRQPGWTGRWGRLLPVLGLGLLLALPARADPADGLDAASRQHYQTATEAERAGNWKRAAAAWRLLLGRDPAFSPAVVGLGRAQEAMGDPAAAARTYARLSSDPDAVEALARLVEEDDPARAAELYKRLTTLRLGDPEPHRLRARALTAIDPAAALAELELWLALVRGEPDGVVIMDLALALREGGEAEQARQLLERYLASWPEGAQADEARGRLDRMAVETAARELAVGASQPLPPELRLRVDEARQRAAAGQLEPALAELREVVQQAPRAAEAWGALGDVHQLLGRVDEAERAYAWAAALAPDEATWHARLGLLLAERYGGRRHREADELLTRALALRPTWGELAWRQGLIRQGMGEWSGAVSAFQAYLDLEPDGSFAAQARQAITDLGRAAPAPSALPTRPEAPADLSEEAVLHYRIARVYWDQGKLAESREELTLALEEAPGWAAALNLQAALDMQAGDEHGAVAAWEASLRADPGQPLVQLNLGQRLRREGRLDEARAMLSQAAEGGAEDAWYQLAELAWNDNQLFVARDHLDRYFAVATGGISREAASGLRSRVERRIRLLQAATGSVVGGGFLLGIGLLLRRRTGKPLSALVDKAPETSHDLARLLSAIRHEVIKHNTTLLDEVADALDNGDHHAVRFAAIRLYGQRRGDKDGVVHRFDAYLSAIERLGRNHGVRLDLRRNDPTLAPMWRAMQKLRRLERGLRRPESASRGLGDELRALSLPLNEVGYQALGQRLREMGSLVLDLDQIVAIDQRVRDEAAFDDVDLPRLELDSRVDGPVAVKVFHGDLEDIVANLLRNAYRAVSTDLDAGLRRVGLVIDEEDDIITGLEHVRLEFRDNAPGRLTDDMIRSRGIGRGLGLVVDLITRHDGSIGVEPVTGADAARWTKAVVVRLPRAEEESEA